MGFYSIYKILKDMYRTIFGNKFLKLIFIIFLFALIFMFLNNKGVFAYSNVNINDIIDTAEANYGSYKYFIISDDTLHEVYIVYRSSNVSNIVMYSSWFCVGFNYNSNGNYQGLEAYVAKYDFNTNSFVYVTRLSARDCLYNKISANCSRSSVCYSNCNCCNESGALLYSANQVYNSFDTFIPPYFITSETDIQNWNFDNLEISGGSVPYYTAFPGGSLEDQTTYIELNLEYNYINYEIGDLTRFLTIDEDTAYWTLSIPSIYLTNFINVENGSTFKFKLYVEQQNPFSQFNISTNEFTFNLTQEQLNKINSDSDKQMQGSIVEQQQQIVQGQQDLNDTINNDNIDDITSDTLPSDSTQDITADGVNGIFTSIYNAFCTGQAQDIVFPIPFTDKSITLNANYVSNALTNANANFIITIIQAFWWYLISRYIIKDVMNKINKIKSGNIEDIETNNIRGDML